MTESLVAKSFHAGTPAEAEKAYDEWAQNYEPDLCAAGYRIPGNIATIFTRFVAADAVPILDAGCGGGIQAEALALIGYRRIVGMDLSEGMMEVARAKGIYESLHRVVMGEPLDFPSNHFAAVLSSGCITPGHAPPNSFDELIRVCRPGGLIVFSMRDDARQLPEYPAAVERNEAAERWEAVFVSESFHSMPYGEAEVTHRIHVYRVA